MFVTMKGPSKKMCPEHGLMNFEMGMAFCPGCGVKLILIESEALRCNKCLRPVTILWRWCPYCGTGITESPCKLCDGTREILQVPKRTIGYTGWAEGEIDEKLVPCPYCW